MIPYILPKITPEMLAAGLEALYESRTECLTDSDTVKEIFWAVYGVGHYHEPETWH